MHLSRTLAAADGRRLHCLHQCSCCFGLPASRLASVWLLSVAGWCPPGVTLLSLQPTLVPSLLLSTLFGPGDRDRDSDRDAFRRSLFSPVTFRSSSTTQLPVRDCSRTFNAIHCFGQFVDPSNATLSNIRLPLERTTANTRRRNGFFKLGCGGLRHRTSTFTTSWCWPDQFFCSNQRRHLRTNPSSIALASQTVAFVYAC